MLGIDKNGIPDIIPRNWATYASCSNSKASVGKRQNVMEGEGETVENEDQAHESKVAQSETCDKDDRHTHATSEASEQSESHPRESKVQEDDRTSTSYEESINAHQPYASKVPDFNEKKRPVANAGADQIENATLWNA